MARPPLGDADISRKATEALSRMMAKTPIAAQAADRADYLTSGTLLIEVEVMQSAVGQDQITCIWSADNSSCHDQSRRAPPGEPVCRVRP